jgi:hypothetical protein
MLAGAALPPISGNASFTKMAQSPIFSCACQIFAPLGSGARLASVAPNARL